jgi:hypothetical protein
MSDAFRHRVSILPIKGFSSTPERRRNSTYPLANSSRKKDRRSVPIAEYRGYILILTYSRWPLVLRFSKGSVHRGRSMESQWTRAKEVAAILFPVLVHALIAAFVVYINQHINSDFNIPSSIVSFPFFLIPPKTYQTSDTIPVHSGRFDACLPKPDSIFKILGRSMSHQYCYDSHTMSFTSDSRACTSTGGTASSVFFNVFS